MEPIPEQNPSFNIRWIGVFCHFRPSCIWYFASESRFWSNFNFTTSTTYHYRHMCVWRLLYDIFPCNNSSIRLWNCGILGMALFTGYIIDPH